MNQSLSPLATEIRYRLWEATEILAHAIPSLHPAHNPEVETAVDDAARNLASQLQTPTEATEAAMSLVSTLYPGSDAPVEFWKSKIGEAIIEHSTLFHGITWSAKEAADWLEISASTVRSLKSRGVLEVDEDNELLAMSVIAYGSGRAWRVVQSGAE